MSKRPSDKSVVVAATSNKKQKVEDKQKKKTDEDDDDDDEVKTKMPKGKEEIPKSKSKTKKSSNESDADASGSESDAQSESEHVSLAAEHLAELKKADLLYIQVLPESESHTKALIPIKHFTDLEIDWLWHHPETSREEFDPEDQGASAVSKKIARFNKSNAIHDNEDLQKSNIKMYHVFTCVA
jgi:hypothetical protein